METLEAIRTILATRAYTGASVSADVIASIVEAGHLTASSQNKQPWHFTVVQNRDTLRELGALSPSGPYIADAAFAIVVTVSPTPPSTADASRAIQSMMLAGWAQGVGSNWVGVPKPDSERHAKLKELLGVPDGQEFVAILPFGVPQNPGGKGKKDRKPLAEIASSERFDKPWSPA